MQARSNTLSHIPTHPHSHSGTHKTLLHKREHSVTLTHILTHASKHRPTPQHSPQPGNTLAHTREHSGTLRNLNTLEYTNTDTVEHNYSRARTYTPKHTQNSAGALKRQHTVLCECGSALACRSKVECVRVCLLLPPGVSQCVRERANVPDVFDCM